MRKKFFFPALVLVFATLFLIQKIGSAQDNPVHLLRQYAKSKPDTSRVHLLIVLKCQAGNFFSKTLQVYN